MRLFHRPSQAHEAIPGLAAAAADRGWQPAPERPLSEDLDRPIHDTACAMFGVGRAQLDGPADIARHRTVFLDGYRFADRGRTITVANARVVRPGPPVPGPRQDVAVCAVDLPRMVPIVAIWPACRPLHPQPRTTTPVILPSTSGSPSRNCRTST